jgi:hypothetical protein
MVMARTVLNFDHNPAGKNLDFSCNIMIESFILYGRDPGRSRKGNVALTRRPPREGHASELLGARSRCSHLI